MAKMSHDELKTAFAPHLLPGEQIRHFAFGVRQPPVAVIILLMLLAVLPGMIAVVLLTKNYMIALTDQRLIVFRVSGPFKPTPKEIVEFDLHKLDECRTSQNAIFVHLKLREGEKRFVAKFHRSLYKGINRTESIAIADTIGQAFPATSVAPVTS